VPPTPTRTPTQRSGTRTPYSYSNRPRPDWNGTARATALDATQRNLASDVGPSGAKRFALTRTMGCRPWLPKSAPPGR
jgi:hypothetical protein